MFRSLKHKIQTLEVNKIALNKDDDKRITIDGMRSLARGHYKPIKRFYSIKNGNREQSGKNSSRSAVFVQKKE